MTLSKILKILKFALLNPEKYDENYIRKKFRKKDYEIFSQFCLGGKEDETLAKYIGPDKLKLTQKGVREYHKLQSEQSQKIFNLLMLTATIVLAISSTALVIVTWVTK